MWCVMNVTLEKIEKEDVRLRTSLFYDSDIAFWRFLNFSRLGCGCSVDIGTKSFLQNRNLKPQTFTKYY